MALSRRSFLLGGAAALAASTLPAGRMALAGSERIPRNLIVVLAYGGWDVTYALDPKPSRPAIDAPPGEVRMFGDLPILTSTARPSVTQYFEAYAPVSAVVNGVQVQSIVHPDCTKRVLTGTASEANPDIGAIAAFEHGRDLPAPYLVLGPTAYTGHLASICARAGTANQIRTLLDPLDALPRPAGSAIRFLPDADEESLIRKYVEARVAREQAARGQHGYNRARIEDFRAALSRGDVLKGYADGFGDDFAFTLDLGIQVDLALNALQTGLCCTAHLEIGSFDTHQANAQQSVLQEQLFAGLKKLADELAIRPGKAPGARMLDETVVAVVSEMSRTPKLNDGAGKDHWPVTSALVLGGGVAGGRAYGASGDGLEALGVDLATGAVVPGGKQLQYGNLAAGLLELVGVDASAHLPNSEPFRGFIA